MPSSLMTAKGHWLTCLWGVCPLTVAIEPTAPAVLQLGVDANPCPADVVGVGHLAVQL